MGQEIGTTPLQIAAAFGALANDGALNRPYVVRAMVGPDGRRTPPRTAERPHQVSTMSPAAARALRHAAQAVRRGTAG